MEKETPALRVDVGAGEARDGEPLFGHPPPFAAHAFALAGVKAGQELVEITIAPVEPAEVAGLPLHQGQLLQGFPRGLIREQQVPAAGTLLADPLAHPFPQLLGPPVTTPARANHRRERNRGDQLGVIGQPVTLVGVRPGEIEYVLAARTIAGVDRHQGVAVTQVTGPPTTARRGGAGVLQGVEKSVGEKGKLHGDRILTPGRPGEANVNMRLPCRFVTMAARR